MVFYKKAAMGKIVLFKRNIFEAAAVKGSMTLYAFNNSVDEHSDAAMNNKWFDPPLPSCMMQNLGGEAINVSTNYIYWAVTPKSKNQLPVKDLARGAEMERSTGGLNITPGKKTCLKDNKSNACLKYKSRDG